MSTSSSVELQATSVCFYSPGNEAAFFNWLDRLPFVEHYGGRERTLYISVVASAVDEDGLRELLALFHRYGVDLKQLAVFDREEFADWFRNEQAYWYKHVFG